MTFMFWMACPLAPLTRLSMDTRMMALPGSRSATTFMNTWLLDFVVPVVFFGVRSCVFPRGRPERIRSKPKGKGKGVQAQVL